MPEPVIHSDDYYKVLGLERNCTEAELRRSYKRLALRWHPDKQPAADRLKAEENFKRISEAYDCLSDAEKRQVYDRYGKAGLEGGAGGGGPGMHFRGGMHDPEEIFRHFFSSGFGGDDDFSFGGGGFGGGFPGSHPFGGMPFEGPQHGFRQTRRCGGGPCGSSCNKTVEVTQVPEETRIWIHSLKSAARFNHMQAVVKGFDPETDRYTVEVDGAGESLAMKPSNFCQLGCKVKVGSATDRPELNGAQGEVTGFNPFSNKYGVKVGAGIVVCLDMASIRLRKGQIVHSSGLENAQYNEKTGKITTEFDGERYEVELRGGRKLRIKPQNLRL